MQPKCRMANYHKWYFTQYSIIIFYTREYCCVTLVFYLFTHIYIFIHIIFNFSKVTMVVLRDESCVPDENGSISTDTTNITDAFDVELTKKPSKGLGLSIVGRKSGSGIFISDIVSGISY